MNLTSKILLSLNLPINFQDLDKSNKLQLLKEELSKVDRQTDEGRYGSLFYMYQEIDKGKVTEFI